MRLHHILGLLLVLLAPSIQAAILAIDYGAEFTKLSLVKPGVPLDVVLDRDSKRKIQSVVSWKRDDRVFGQEGKQAATRFPDAHYPYVKPLLGVSQLSQSPLYPNAPQIAKDGSIYFQHPSSGEAADQWSPTAILAHQISYYRQLAEAPIPGQTPETISQVIVTVPAWWNQYQRKAYRDALELQGLTCLAMIGEGTGVALNFAMTRSFPTYDPATGEGEKEYHLIYDSGAMSTTATVIAFYQTSVLPKPKAKTAINTTHIEILGTGYEEVGGVLLDLQLQEALLKDFVKKSGQTGAGSDKRALAKLAKEAVRVKHILSANQESNVNIESLYDDIDFRSKYSRTDLEGSLSSSAQLFASPIASALASTNVSLADLTSVILFGGNTRVPLVQDALKSVLADEHVDKIAQNVNTDEAAVLGAAFYGAGLSRQFKMKNIEIHEIANEDFYMNDEIIFAKGSELDQRKTIGLEPKDDISFEFRQGNKPITALQIHDVSAALANFTSPSPIVNLTLRLDARGHLATVNAVLVSNASEAEIEAESGGGVAGALKGLFGKKDKEIDEAAEDDEESPNDTKKEKAKDKKAKAKKPEKIALKFREKHLGVKPLTGEEKRKTMSRLTAIAAAESAKFSREEARNILEGYLYKLSSMLDPEAERRAILDFASEDERDVMSKLVSSTFGWLGDHAETATEKDLVQKRRDLETLERPIVIRFSEMQTRGKAIEDFQQAMFAARAFYVEAHKNNTAALDAAKEATPERPVAPPKFTDEELKTVGEMMKENEVWMDTLMEKQIKIENDPTKDPVIFTSDLNDRGKKLQSTVLRLVNKKAPRAPRPSTSSSSSTTTATESATSESSTITSSDAKETKIPPHEEL